MAPRVAPAAFVADNSSGSLNFGCAAACNDWRLAVRRFHVGTDHTVSTQMPDIRLQASPLGPSKTINSLWRFGGESIYVMLGQGFWLWVLHCMCETAPIALHLVLEARLGSEGTSLECHVSSRH